MTLKEINRIWKSYPISEEPLNNEKWDFHSVYYIPRSQNTQHGVKHPDTKQTAKIWSLELENTRIIWKIFIESEKDIKITATILGNGKFIIL